MKKTLIITIARLDNNYQNKLSFKYNEISSDQYAHTSLFFKKEVLTDRDCDILFLFPISLPIQDFKQSGDSYIEECKSTNIDEYLASPFSIIEKHPHIKNNKYLIIPSLGRYVKNGEERVFNSNLETIILHIITKLINEYIEVDELYIDISGGHNIYNIAMLSAVQKFLPIYELHHGFLKKLTTKIIYSDPIIPGVKTEYKVNESDFTSKAFFELPYKIEEMQKIQTIVQHFEKENRKNYINFYQTYFPLLFYSIKNGFVLLIPQIIEEIEKENIKPFPLEKQIPININDDLKDNFSVYLQIYFSNSLFNGIIDSYKKSCDTYQGISEGTLMFNWNHDTKELAIENENTLVNFFEQFKAKDSFLRFKSELRNLCEKDIDFEKLINANAKVENDDFTDDFLKSGYKKNNQFDPRNFVAHSGLEKNSILLKLLEYNDQHYRLAIKLKDLSERYANIAKYCMK